MTFEKCLQEKCSHNPDNDSIPSGMQKDLMCAMCPICNCGCEPHMINTGCVECLKCENTPNFIRGGKQKPLVEIEIKQTNDVQIVRELVMKRNEKQM